MLRASGNAYLSHFTHVRETMENIGDGLSLAEFLQHFGIKRGKSLNTMENRIISILEKHGITLGADVKYDHQIRNRIAEQKPRDGRLIIDHDAEVCTMMRNSSGQGFILATWDNVMIDAVEEIARIFADTPARVIAFLSMTEGMDYKSEQTVELLSTLLHIDEKVAEKLAKKIEQIRSTEQAFRLKAFIDAAREKNGASWTFGEDEMSRFLDQKAILAEEAQRASGADG